ncbi:GPI ethanolamine phosphate transferase 3 [Apiospora phragmitis]|uniref:GPI ethanolamine phosphate transferase 3 n=1 Tax=Apiospora phragmitis TaxID=2905665 RepID=A0ABR1TRT8_9PEZI
MPQRHQRPKDAPSEYQTIAAQYAQAKRLKEIEDANKKLLGAEAKQERSGAAEKQRQAFEARRRMGYERRFGWNFGFWIWMTCIHVVGIVLFTGGFLLTRLVLDEKSECSTFDKAVVVLIDALRYDFTVPVKDLTKAEIYHNAFPFLYETAVQSPNNAVLLPFIADPPTSTLQRLKGLTTGTLPTLNDLGSSFGGTAIEEDNLLMQLNALGKRIVHLGDDTWTSSLPGYFEANISKPYDSFNVWDLHTVDNGWDVLIGHFLGVDHAGHRYGPNHAAMTAKLQQMNTFVQDLVETLEDDTVLIVMGDHGMDSKGDHGGESDDEVEAALWMYSKRPVFGRTLPEYVTPPATAKERPVNQIDLVPTLALLLGLPIPFNNLGRPIEEAFAGIKGNAWDNLAAVSRLASAGIRRYQASYFVARGIEQTSKPGSPAELWDSATQSATENTNLKARELVYRAYTAYQEETLRICKDLWARFDVPKMASGIVVMALGVLVLLVYVSRDEDDDFAVLDDAELDLAEKSLELQDAGSQTELPSYQTLSQSLVKSALIGGVIGAALGAGYVSMSEEQDWSMAAAIPRVNQFASSDCLAIWTGEELVQLTTEHHMGMARCDLHRKPVYRICLKLIYHMGGLDITVLLVDFRIPSFSKLCREEQMPYCTSTYYASANSSTSAPWQLALPFIVFAGLPSIIKGYLVSSRSYEALAPFWIGYVFRRALGLAATYWTLDAAGNGQWLIDYLPETTLKTIQVAMAQGVLALAFVAGTTAFVWAPPCISVFTKAGSGGRTAQVTILGYGNANGARYLLLVVNFAAACMLLSKPMGSSALALMLWQVLSLVDMVDLNGLATESIGPVVLALLGEFYYFKTGHQAVLSSIQWDSAFIPLFTLRYPWSPLVVMFNTFAGQILACVAVPLLALWKTSPKRKGGLETVTRCLGIFVAYYAVESLATMVWAGHLRRHLMLFRVFNPRFMMAAAVLLVVDLVGIVVALAGVRTNTLAVSEVFGWAD